MNEFAEVVAPFKKNFFFEKEEKEGGPSVLKSVHNEKEMYVIATHNSDIMCNYAIASTAISSEKAVEINGQQICIKPAQYYKARTFFKKDNTEIEKTMQFESLTELSLMFGNALYLRRFNKNKRFKGPGSNLHIANNDLIMQTISSTEEGKENENSSNRIAQLEPLFPPKNPNALYPKELYDIRSIMGFDPYAAAEEIESSLKGVEIELGEHAARVLQRNTVSYEQDTDSCIWICLFDSICKIILASRKRTPIHLFEIEPPLQSIFIKKILKGFFSPSTRLDSKLHVFKEIKEKLVVRIILLILLRDNNLLRLDNYPGCFFGLTKYLIVTMTKELGCIRVKSLNRKEETALDFVLTIDKKEEEKDDPHSYKGYSYNPK